MLELGIHHAFDFVDENTSVDESIVYYMPTINMRLTVEVEYCKLINVETGAEVTMQVTNFTHTVKEVEIKSSKINGLVPSSGRFYMEIKPKEGGFSNIIFSDGVIKYTDCTMQIDTSNSCSDEHYDWDSDLLGSVIAIPNFAYLEPGFKSEKTSILDRDWET